MTAATAGQRELRAAIVGGGFAGVGAAIKLREAGIEDFVLLEKADRLGGTWRDNTYPGCGCDVPSTLYSYSFAPNPEWSRVFARRAEIQDYLEETAERYGVPQHVRTGTELLEASWDDAGRRWMLDTTTGRYTANALIVGAGPLHEPIVPDLPGLESFRGKVFHSGRWDHSHDLTGKRVAVVGTGASAVQFVPHIRREAASVHVFQRTPAWVLPKFDPKISDRWKAAFRRFPLLLRVARAAMWCWMEGLTAAAHHPRAVRPAELYGLQHLRRAVPDPELRRALTPSFTLGCKRILLSNSFYRALRKPNVELVPSAVSEVRSGSVVTANGVEREVDTIIFGTGFHITDLPIADRIRGRTGRSLAETWNGSPEAYKGTTVAGFPNAFMLFGPNIGVISAFALIEAQVKYVVDALRMMDERELATVEVRREVQAAFNERVQRSLQGTVWNAGGCQSYYLDANGRNSTVWPWSVMRLRWALRRFDPDGYLTEKAPMPALPPAVNGSREDARAASVVS